MHWRLFLFSTAVLMLIGPAIALAGSDPAVPYTLQVAAFPTTDLADRFAVKLVRAGERPFCATVELQARGYWTRVFVGLFSTSEAARRYGENLVGRGVVDEFLVRRADPNQAVTRPRRVTGSDPEALASVARHKPPSTRHAVSAENFILSPAAAKGASLPESARNATLRVRPVAAARETYASPATPLPDFRASALGLAPRIDTGLIPRPEPVTLALRLVVGEVRPYRVESRNRGGLWITGDTAEGLARLRWIVGAENAQLIKLDPDGRVQLDRRLLANTGGLGPSRAGDAVQVAKHIWSNEGLLLLVQLAEGRYRYRLHTGRQVPTLGKIITISGSINLDTNFDSRINRYRKDGKKLAVEQPPEGFDSLVAMNPDARWYNLSSNYWVQTGAITFHELAEAYAKIELGLDYLDQGSQPGAHALAIERERRLKSQRPSADIVLTAGSNRVLRTEKEVRLFYAEGPAGVSQR
ncbi:MAG: SPOR domain-containing protein [Acidobacteriota bacterium]